MKHSSLRMIAVIIPAIAAFNVTIAQGEKNLSDLSSSNLKDYTLTKKMRNTLVEDPGTPTPDISVRAVKKFDKQYKNVENERWFKIENGSVAEFEKDGITTKVFYTPKGSWHATLRYYQEDKLPKDIRHMVKSVYYDFNIIIVIEVFASNKMAYLVKIESKDMIKTIRVLDGEMDEYESFQKRN